MVSNQVVEVDITDEQAALPVDESRLRQAVEAVLAEEPIQRATISVAVVDNATIHRLNQQYLNHDEPTDVLSFVLDRTENSLEGEVVVSADTARSAAPQFGWSAADELLLYVVHGVLHLVGYDDILPGQRGAMRKRERACLAGLGLEYRFDDSAKDSHAARAAPGSGGERKS